MEEGAQYYTTCPSPVGTLTLACRGGALTGLWIEGQKYHGPAEGAVRRDGLPVFREAREWLESYFGGGRPAAGALPLSLEGSAFRLRVWQALRDIPYGGLTTYGQLAKKLPPGAAAGRVSARAVGGAVGRNPISIIIPCHRVVGANGSLTGYAAGTDIKRRLLELENSN